MPPDPARLRLAPELPGLIAQARAEIDRAIDLGGLRNDPIRHALTALATHLDALYRVLTDATLTIGAQLEEARRPVSDEDLRRLSKVAADGAWRVTAGMVRAHLWRSILIAVAASLLLLIGAFGAGYWFHGSQQLVAGVSAGRQECFGAAGRHALLHPGVVEAAAGDGACRWQNADRSNVGQLHGNAIRRANTTAMRDLAARPDTEALRDLPLCIHHVLLQTARNQEEPVATPAPTPAAPPEPTAAAAPPERPPAPAAVTPQILDEPDPPLRAAPPDDVAKRFTSFRLPVSLDEDLRAMMFETRRSKQDLLIEFVTEGVKMWRRDRAKRS